ncbi:hypothetical protein [Pedobacter deserti]|uniref:hypothetical protein n=1 Tax=Pedobacter deserti TaxID=2817382 RepID=UPI00210B6CBE|nr:hypothetical protein [Pedobacter sp. SYSU D00382]
MKIIAAGWLLLCLSVCQSFAQGDSLSNHIIGTWELSSYMISKGGASQKGMENFKRFRIHTRYNYTDIFCEPKTGRNLASMTGSYRYHPDSLNSNFLEHATTVTPQFKPVLNALFRKNLSILNKDELVFTWVADGADHRQVWSRVKKAKAAAAPQVVDSMAAKIVGSWDLLKYDYGRGQTADQTVRHFRRVKLYDGSSFSVADINPQDFITRTAFAGNYFTGNVPSKKGNYEENQWPLNNALPKGEEKRFVTNMRFEGDQLLIFEWEADGHKCSETWMRIGGWEPTYDAKTLLVISVGDKYIRVRPTAEHPQPFILFANQPALGIQHIKDATGVQRFGWDAVHGVVVLKLSEEVFLKNADILRERKIIE